LKYIWRSFSLGCHFHVYFSYPWHAFASHGLPAIAELLVYSVPCNALHWTDNDDTPKSSSTTVYKQAVHNYYSKWRVYKDPTSPQVCRYTTLWNVSVIKATADNKTTSVTTRFKKLTTGNRKLRATGLSIRRITLSFISIVVWIDVSSSSGRTVRNHCKYSLGL